MTYPVPDWWRHEQTPDDIFAEAQRHFTEGLRLLSLLPADYSDLSMVRRHGGPLSGEGIEAPDIEGITYE